MRRVISLFIASSILSWFSPLVKDYLERLLNKKGNECAIILAGNKLLVLPSPLPLSLARERGEISIP